MSVPLRQLAPGQTCQVWVHDTSTGQDQLIFETETLLLEAPNWPLAGDALILNGNGTLWRLPLDAPVLEPIVITGLPQMNNDHVLDPDGRELPLGQMRLNDSYPPIAPKS